MNIYEHISHLFTMQPVIEQGLKNAASLQDCGYIAGATVVVDDEYRVRWVGPSSQAPETPRQAKVLQCRGETWLPGLIDCHTHLVFAGQRAGEMLQKRSGKSYLEIARAGGGIQSTVAATRGINEAKLQALAEARVVTAKALGVRHLEVKSGYGLDVENELKQLRVIEQLKNVFRRQMTFTATFLGAHGIPKGKSADAYTTEICEVMLPQVAEKKLAEFCDVFIEDGFFNLKQGRQILRRAKDLGLKLKAHVDECSAMGGVELACELGATSIEHGIKLTGAGLKALINSNTTAVLLPMTSFVLQEGFAPGRKMVDGGVRVAMATDFNPGSSPSQNLLLAAQMGMIHYRLSPFEVLSAITANAAVACGKQDTLGCIAVDRPAVFTRLGYEDWQELFYWVGQPLPVIS